MRPTDVAVLSRQRLVLMSYVYHGFQGEATSLSNLFQCYKISNEVIF